MEVVLRQIGYTLDEINSMTEKQILYRFFIGQKFLTGGAESSSVPNIPMPTPPSPSSARGMRQSPSGTSYNFPR